MGAISDGKFNSVAEYNKQQRALYTRMYGSGVQTQSPFGQLLTGFATQGIWTLAEKLGAKEESSDNEVEKEDNSAVADTIRADIAEKLKKVECSNINEVESKLEAASTALQSIGNELAAKQSRLESVEAQIQLLSPLPGTENEIPTTLEVVNNQNVPQGWLSDLLKEKETLVAEIAELTKKQETQEKQCTSLAATYEDLQTLSKQLLKAEGQDAIVQLTNEQTKNYTDAVKELKEAIQKGDKGKQKEAALEIEAAYEAYYKANPAIRNKTLDKGYELAKQYLPQ